MYKIIDIIKNNEKRKEEIEIETMKIKRSMKVDFLKYVENINKLKNIYKEDEDKIEKIIKEKVEKIVGRKHTTIKEGKVRSAVIMIDSYKDYDEALYENILKVVMLIKVNNLEVFDIRVVYASGCFFTNLVIKR